MPYLQKSDRALGIAKYLLQSNVNLYPGLVNPDTRMKLREIAKLVEAKVVCGNIESVEIERGFSSDLMSDVLTLDTDKMLLITGMANLQAIRTADMADVHCILFVRNKKATAEMLALGHELGIIILESPLSMFRISGMLFCAGLDPVY